MFSLEILNLLNQYKNADEYEKKKIENSLKRIIQNNKEEFLNFAQTKKEQLDEQIKQFMQKCYDEVEDEEKKKELTKGLDKEDKTDFEIIKSAYQKWLEQFINNQNTVNEKCEQIIKEIISHYAPNQLETLKKIIYIKDDENYESFKNMINNYLRIYFAEKIEKYYQSQQYKSLGFFKKRSKKKQILKLLNQIGRYEFNKEEIEQVLK